MTWIPMGNKWLNGIKRWQKIVLVYGTLLVLSHFVVWLMGNGKENGNDVDQQVEVQVISQNYTKTDKKLSVPYQDIYRGQKSNPPVLLLLPGGPEGPNVFNQLIPRISSEYRIVIPHLPGLGEKASGLPNYSFKSLAMYTEQFLDKLELSDVHVIGYGLGGAGAINLAHSVPQRIKSLSLVSAIGVQELELLGSYRLNHAVHGLQLGAVWALYNAVPHFGLMHALNIDVSYAKSHYESDLRPLRSYLKQYEAPLLILHGKDDPLVPLAAAKEHHRIVPQSILKTYSADHDLVKTHSDSVAQALSVFISDVETGSSITAKNAPKDRIAEAKKPFSNVDFAKFQGVSLLIIMLIIVLGTFVSEDLTCIGAGLLAARGLIGFWPASLACFIGIFVGDIGLYLAGRFLGRPAIGKAPFKWLISEKDLEKSAHWFDARGPAIIIATRFLPGSRMPTYFSAGVIKASFWMFVFYFFLAAAVWTPMLVGVSKLLGNELIRYFSIYKDYALWVVLGAVAFMVMFIKLVIPIFSYKGRRLLVSRYRRLVNWEYWSPLVLYAPVFFYIVYLGIKYRCLTLFTATNPAIPDSGFVGESKTEILELFNDEAIAQYESIPSELSQEQMLEHADNFMSRHDLRFPVALKPDVGERGEGVEIIRSFQKMEEYFSDISQDVIIQEYIEGTEFGVFYYHKPDEPRGRIFSITKKELLYVVGDGQSTIQELILSDDQAVNLAKHHLEHNEDRLFDIPEEGEKVQIVDLGTHARGALFSDGKHLISESLVDKMNQLCQPVPGYNFGRFDIKVPSDEHLKEGKDLRIIEVNGVTSESTNIYDPQYSFWDAQKVLLKQWELAFEIGNKNRERGTSVTPLFPFLKRVFGALSN